MERHSVTGALYSLLVFADRGVAQCGRSPPLITGFLLAEPSPSLDHGGLDVEMRLIGGREINIGDGMNWTDEQYPPHTLLISGYTRTLPLPNGWRNSHPYLTRFLWVWVCGMGKGTQRQA